MILCANTISNERKIFLENVGIECKEIPFSEFVNIADRYQYTFLDTKKHKSEDLDLFSDLTHFPIAPVMRSLRASFNLLSKLWNSKEDGDVYFASRHKFRDENGWNARFLPLLEEDGVQITFSEMDKSL